MRALPGKMHPADQFEAFKKLADGGAKDGIAVDSTAFENATVFRDFQTEYTPVAISNSHHQ
jgi:hypothetical protein